LGRFDRLLHRTSYGKKTVFERKRGYTDSAELWGGERRKRLLIGLAAWIFRTQGTRRKNVGAVKALAAVSEGAELVRRCRAGDGAAWEEIVQSYSRRIYNLAYRFTSRADTAEDLTQEVFVRVYRSLDQYDPKQGDLQNWLMRLARNLIIDDYRKRQRTPHDNHADDLADHTYHLHTRTNSVQQEMERRELGTQVQAGIDKLSPDLRTCVILRDIEELSYQEIVDLLKIPEGTVKSRINRGRIELAKILRRMKVVAMSEA
jgi:RNA polymerase sigma-70 factor (ECF subfamily)